MPLPGVGYGSADPFEVAYSRGISSIRAQTEAQREQVRLNREKFEESVRQRNQILAMFQSLYPGGIEGRTQIPSEFGESVGLFRRGGQFGAGGRAEVRRGAQQALASGQIGAVQTGMSSGTNIAGLRARVAADEALARKKIEGERVTRLGGALTTAGQAGLETQRFRSAERADLLRTLASFG